MRVSVVLDFDDHTDAFLRRLVDMRCDRNASLDTKSAMCSKHGRFLDHDEDLVNHDRRRTPVFHDLAAGADVETSLARAVHVLNAINPWILALKSGPCTRSMYSLMLMSGRPSASTSPASTRSTCRWMAEATSVRLCGGIRVAIPTAIPSEPLSNRFGNREGRAEAPVRCRRSWAGRSRCLSGCLRACGPRFGPDGSPCTASRQVGRRRCCRSCLARPPGIAQGEVLGHANHGFVDGSVVRLVFPITSPSDRPTSVLLVVRVAALEHAVQRVDAVSGRHGRQAAPADDDGHGVIDVRRPSLP